MIWRLLYFKTNLTHNSKKTDTNLKDTILQEAILHIFYFSMVLAETVIDIEENRKPLVGIDTNNRTISSGSIRVRLNSKEIERVSDNDYTISVPATDKENELPYQDLKDEEELVKAKSKHSINHTVSIKEKNAENVDLNFSDDMSKLCMSSPSSDVIAPALLFYRESSTSYIQQSVIPVTGSDVCKYLETEPFQRDDSENLTRNLFCGSLYADIPIPSLWTDNAKAISNNGDKSRDDKAIKAFQYDALENTCISWKSEGTEKILAERGFMDHSVSNKYESSLGQYSETGNECSSTRTSFRDTDKYSNPQIDEFQIPYFDLQKEIDTVFSCLDEGKRKTKRNLYKKEGEKSIKPIDYKNTSLKRPLNCISGKESLRENKKRIKSNNNTKNLEFKYSLENTSKIKKLTKASGPRKKTGCWTCRLRRKKCSEEKPSCRECIRLGLKCEGYMKERPAFMRDPSLARRMKEEIKKVTLAQKRRGSKQKYELELKMGQTNPFETNTGRLERQPM